MNLYAELTLVATLVVYVVDLSGFTGSWRAALARLLGVRELRSLPPFDCSLCMVWWCCLAWALFRGQLSLPTVAASAALSLLSVPMCNTIITIRDWLDFLIRKAGPHEKKAKT